MEIIKKILVGALALFICGVLTVAITITIMFLAKFIPSYVNFEKILEFIYWVTIIILTICACYSIGNELL